MQINVYGREPKICQCFIPAIFDLSEHVKVENSKSHAENTDGSSASTKTTPLAMFMEEMEQEDSQQLPGGVHTKITADHINAGDWLAVIYDKN